MLRNRPTLSIGTERLACLNSPLACSTRQVPGSRPEPRARQVSCARFFLHPPFLPPPGDSFLCTFPTKPTKVLGLLYTTGWMYYNSNTIKSYKILQKLSPKHTAQGVAQSPYPIYRHGKACLSKQPPLACSPRPSPSTRQVRVRAPGPAGALRALFSPPSLPSSPGRLFSSYLPHQTHKSVRVKGREFKASLFFAKFWGEISHGQLELCVV